MYQTAKLLNGISSGNENRRHTASEQTSKVLSHTTQYYDNGAYPHEVHSSRQQHELRPKYRIEPDRNELK